MPGLAAIELLDFKPPSLVESLALAFGTSAAIDSLLLLVRTSGYVILGTRLDGIWPGTVHIILGISTIALVLGLVLRRKASFYVRPSRSDMLLLLVIAVQFLLLVVHFIEYPIFPEFNSTDFTQHAMIANDLHTGGTVSIPAGILYYGVHTILAAALAIDSAPLLIVTQYVMDVLVAFSPLLVFAATKAVSGSDSAALIAAGLYVGSGFLWFGSVFDAGLYPNFYGFLMAFLLIFTASLAVKEPRGTSSWVLYLIAVLSSFFTHYSTLTLIPALLALPVLCYLFTRKISKVYVALAAIPILPMAVLIAVDPKIVSTLLGFVAASAVPSVTGDSAISPFFSWFPFLRYVFAVLDSDLATLTTLFVGAFGGYLVLKRRQPFAFIPLFWLLSVLVAAPFSDSAWRFSYVGLVSIVILAAEGLAEAIPRRSKTSPIVRKGKKSSTGRKARNLLVLMLLILMIAGSWGTKTFVDGLVNGSTVGHAQNDVYQSMIWFANNTPPDGRLISVTDSKFNYMGVFTGRSAAYSPQASPGSLLSQVRGEKDVYVALTRVGTISVSQEEYANLISSYHSDSHFSLAYNNSDVQIYSINTTAA